MTSGTCASLFCWLEPLGVAGGSHSHEGPLLPCSCPTGESENRFSYLLQSSWKNFFGCLLQISPWVSLAGIRAGDHCSNTCLMWLASDLPLELNRCPKLCGVLETKELSVVHYRNSNALKYPQICVSLVHLYLRTVTQASQYIHHTDTCEQD
jgi:hypothetical protein